jgi:DHA1 family multidrug resistance protein-like MFS transporter
VDNTPTTVIEPAAEAAAAARRALIGASVLVATGWATTLVYVAVIPQFQADRDISTAQLGWFGTAGFIATFIGQAFVAPSADRRSQRQVMALASTLLVVGLTWLAVGQGYWWLVAARGVSGLGLGILVPVATAAVMRLAAEPGKAAGRLQAATSAGIALGPLFGGLAADRLSVTWILGGAAIAAAMATPAILMLPAGSTEVQGLGGGGASELLRSRRFLGATLIGGAFMAAVGAYDTLWSRYLDDLGATPALIGLSFVLFAIPYALWAGTAGRASDRLGPATVAQGGAVVMVGSIVVYALSASPWLSTLVALVESSGQAFVAVAATVAVTASASVERQATAHGLSSGIGTLIAASTAAIAAPLYAGGGGGVLFGATAVAYVVLMTAGLLLYRSAPARV